VVREARERVRQEGLEALLPERRVELLAAVCEEGDLKVGD